MRLTRNPGNHPAVEILVTIDGGRESPVLSACLLAFFLP
jgi:hypothetical protein